ncbi:hypothetical protein PIB30_038624 [Stylosanthes scabra]|uniref:ADP-ribosyl cyclase/cyclic ADP-ribose hydrolase n=1 Tax=Stylosanthes scabra TaxID=79078 RepID=A0ABU6UDT5_9FABA|nr:hypothetical protein [Stylosanthes scabra]
MATICGSICLSTVTASDCFVNWNDAELIEEIIKSVNTRLKILGQVHSKRLVGIGKSIARVESLLRQDPESVRVIGIWGVGGIGKTTIAEQVYNLLRDEYEAVVFLRNVREVSLRRGIINLKNELFYRLLGEDPKIEMQNGLPAYVEKRIGRMKVLIVLDDVNLSEQFEILVGKLEFFGSGSRILVTTRDRQVLAKHVHVHDTYKVEPLDYDEALELFNLIAFQQDQTKKEYTVPAERVVVDAKGVSVVLKTLAAHLLRGKDKWKWESELEKLGNISNNEIFDTMSPSYDDLDQHEKSLLSYIASFFDAEIPVAKPEDAPPSSYPEKQIITFLDTKLKEGSEISLGLLQAIEKSLISLVVFSENYAFSHWCLEELLKIMECRREQGQIVLPVFYRVEPSDVRHQKGVFFAAFAKQENKHGKQKVQTWRSAFGEAANISGFHSAKFRNDAELIDKIVESVNTELKNMSQVHSKILVGIAKRIARVESLLRQEPESVRVIGIQGIGGIGKTTIAEEAYKLLHHEYEAAVFLRNVRDVSLRHGIIYLKNKLFSKLLRDNLEIETKNGLPTDVEKRIGRIKVLIVLDDVDESQQFENLVGKLQSFGSGSRIIVTTRDWQVLAKYAPDSATYKVEPLEFNEALQLFNLIAFQHNQVEKEYLEQAKRIVPHAQGIPLVLKILAHQLHGKNKRIWGNKSEKLDKIQKPLDSGVERQRLNLTAFQQNQTEKEHIVLAQRAVAHAKGIPVVLKILAHLLRGKDKWIWEREMGKLGNIQNKKVFDIMRLSYDDLDLDQKSILLDIACFFNGMKLKVKYLEGLLSNGSFRVHAALKRLEDISFITISKEDEVTMHDVVKEMAWEIVRHESIEDPANHSRIWSPDHIYHVLKYNQGSEAIRSLKFSYSKATVRDMQFSPLVFSKMSKLRFLDFYGEQDLLKLPEGLQQLPSRLRYLRWTYYPLNSLPKEFSAENLVILELPYSKVEKLWSGIQNLEKLKVLKVPYSSQLKQFPDLSRAINLEILDLKYCLLLTRVHPSLFSLNKLETLDLSWCSSLTRLETNAHLASLRYLSLYHCKNLNKFSVISENMTELDLRHTLIRGLPSSFGCQSKLEKLHLANSEIKRMPDNIKLLTSLKYLDISDCKNLQTLPELPLSIETLDADNCTSLKAVFFPNISEQLKENKKRVLFWNCLKLEKQFLKALTLNAYINMVRFSNQYLSAALEHDNVDNSNEDPEASYVYPGSIVPKWFRFQTTTDHLTVNLSSAPYAPKLGFILCFIVPAVPYEGVSLVFTISGDDEDDGNEVIKLNVDRPGKGISWDHVILFYDQSCTSFLNERGKVRRMFKIKVSAVSRLIALKHVPVELKGFGVHPVNPLKYPSFIENMEVLGYHTPVTLNQVSLWNGIWSWIGSHN